MCDVMDERDHQQKLKQRKAQLEVNIEKQWEDIEKQKMEDYDEKLREKLMKDYERKM